MGNGSNNRNIGNSFLDLNNSSSGFQPVQGTNTFTYNKDSISGTQSGTSSCILQLQPTDRLRLRMIRQSGNYVLRSVGNACNVVIISF